MNSIYQPLVEGNKATGEVQKILVSNIEYLDANNYRLTLYEDIYDSEGNHFKASDAVFSITTCKEFGNVSGMAYIGGAKVVSDYVFDINITRDADYQFSASVSMIFMVTEKAYKDSGDDMTTKPVGTGPYKMVDYESGSNVTLEAVDDYWGAYLADTRETNSAWYWFAQNVDRIEFSKISEAAQASIALETGATDVSLFTTGVEATRFLGNPNFNVWRQTDSRSFNVFFNCGDKSPMSDQLLRQAVCYAIDNASVLKATGGFGILSTTFGAKVFNDVNPKWDNEDYYNYNPDKAKALLAESGFDVKTPIRLMVPNTSEERTTIGTVLQGYLNAIGLNVQIDLYDSASFTNNKFNEDMYDIRLEDASFENLADLWTQFLSYEGRASGKSNIHITDPVMQELLDNCTKTSNRIQANIDPAHYYIKEQAYIYGLYCRELFDVTRADITEFVVFTKLYAIPGAFRYEY